MDEIAEEVKTLFDSVKKIKKTKHKFRADKSGKSYVTKINFQIKGGGLIHIACYDFSKKMKWPDGINVSLYSKEWNTYQKNK